MERSFGQAGIKHACGTLCYSHTGQRVSLRVGPKASILSPVLEFFSLGHTCCPSAVSLLLRHFSGQREICARQELASSSRRS